MWQQLVILIIQLVHKFQCNKLIVTNLVNLLTFQIMQQLDTIEILILNTYYVTRHQLCFYWCSTPKQFFSTLEEFLLDIHYILLMLGIHYISLMLDTWRLFTWNLENFHSTPKDYSTHTRFSTCLTSTKNFIDLN